MSSMLHVHVQFSKSVNADFTFLSRLHNLKFLFIIVDIKMDKVWMHCYAQVANGYRRPIPSMWPSALRTLIETCWAEQPEKRPSMKLVFRTLTDLSKRPDDLQKLSPRGSSGMSRMGSDKKGCCVVM